MQKCEHVVEVFLQPGELYFGDKHTRIRTVLGSCVSLVFWNQSKHIGGMCHYMLPSRKRHLDVQLDGRYANEAMEMALNEIRSLKTTPSDYKVKMFGGGNMFPEHVRSQRTHVGSQNVSAARELIQKHGFTCVSEHVEGIGHRNIIFDISTGDVFVRHTTVSPTSKVSVRALDKEHGVSDSSVDIVTPVIISRNINRYQAK